MRPLSRWESEVLGQHDVDGTGAPGAWDTAFVAATRRLSRLGWLHDGALTEHGERALRVNAAWQAGGKQ